MLIHGSDVHLGIEMSANTPPSPLQILKLASNKELRAAASNVAAKLREAGVNITREVGHLSLGSCKSDFALRTHWSYSQGQ